jgi:DNA-binding CsgD family transcriptional regulator
VISPFTVQTHISKILGKLEVRSKTEAVALALNNGFS